MKIQAKIKTKPSIKIEFSITGLEPNRSANHFAAALEEALQTRVGFMAQLAKAFEKAFVALPEFERMAFLSPSKVLSETKLISNQQSQQLKRHSAILEKFKKKGSA